MLKECELVCLCQLWDAVEGSLRCSNEDGVSGITALAFLNNRWNAQTHTCRKTWFSLLLKKDLSDFIFTWLYFIVCVFPLPPQNRSGSTQRVSRFLHSWDKQTSVSAAVQRWGSKMSLVQSYSLIWRLFHHKMEQNINWSFNNELIHQLAGI